MRVLGMILAAFLMLTCATSAEETGVANDMQEALPSDTVLSEYPLKWQRRLLAVQLAFAATLRATDEIETGSITPQAQ